MIIKKTIISIIAAGCLLSLPFVYANDAPVEDVGFAPSETSSNNNSGGGTSEERLGRLEQQVTNVTNMNLPQQIEELRQQVQQLSGRLQEQQHTIQLLQNQQRNFYDDLNHRMQQVTHSGETAPAPGNQAQPTTDTSKDSDLYRAAFGLLVKKQYDNALNQFQDYVNHYPQGAFIASAYYWTGELYLQKKDLSKAEQAFARVISQYPTSNKVPEAKLKLATIHITQGKAAQARGELQAIKQQYPNSPAAQLAKIQLQQMQ